MGKKKNTGLHGCIKGTTLLRKAKLFYNNVMLENEMDSAKDLWLICWGLKVENVKALYVHNISPELYASLISDFLQADLAPFGLRVGKPIPNEFGGYTYLLCR